MFKGVEASPFIKTCHLVNEENSFAMLKFPKCISTTRLTFGGNKRLCKEEPNYTFVCL